MKLVRLTDVGLTHAVVALRRTWCGRVFKASAFLTDTGDDPQCDSCLRAMEGPLGPRKK